MPANCELYPWLAPHWQKLSLRKHNNQLPHALLITGINGVGKSAFATYAAKSFLCEVGGHQFCGNCHSCKLFAAGTHPDYLPTRPAEGKQIIGIDSIRKLIDELALTPQCGQRKIALIEPAEAMNIQAANCLLKTLEEPAAADTLLLVTSTPGLIPVTIRSRCQMVKLTVSDSTKVIEWLNSQGIENPANYLALDPQAPLNIAQLADKSVQSHNNQILKDLTLIIGSKLPIEQFASSYANFQASELLKLFSHWFAAGIRLKMCCAEENADNMYINQLINNFDIDKMFLIYNKIQELRRIDSSSFRTRTVLEGLLADMKLIHMK